jgi:UDP-N-acetylglucosamine acyltransferase
MQRNGNASVHPLAVVEPGAKLDAGVSVGPFCHVGPEAVLGERVRLLSHVSVTGATTIGAGTVIYPHAALGGLPQNTKHKGGRTTLVIGRNCTIREAVTMHLGTDTSCGHTVVGDNGNFLAYSHVGHDAIVGSNVTFANAAMVGGHVEVGDFVTIGGLAAVHQFVRIGHHAFIGGCSAVIGDVIPYGMAVGNRASLRGLNVIGMKRSGLPSAEIQALRKAYRMLFDRARPVSENMERVADEFAGVEPVADLLSFITERGKRHLSVPSLRGGGSADDDALD